MNVMPLLELIREAIIFGNIWFQFSRQCYGQQVIAKLTAHRPSEFPPQNKINLMDYVVHELKLGTVRGKEKKIELGGNRTHDLRIQ